MSSAATINATQSSGQTAGSPVTIITDGTITPKLYGTGSGAWSVTANFAPVVGGVIGDPISLTITQNTPNAVGPSTRTDAVQWVGWITAQAGLWSASGIVEGITGPDAQSGFLGSFAVGALPQYAVEAGSVAMEGGTLVRYGGAGVGWLPMGVDESLTLAELLATTGSAGATAKCLDPMFGPMGAMFDWAQSLGKWVPRNARIYGTGVRTVYTASAGDINTDVQVGALAIPESLVFPGIEIKSTLAVIRAATGSAGAVNSRLYFPGPFTIVALNGIGIGSEGRGQGFMYMPSSKTTLLRSGAPTAPHSGFGLNASASFSPVGGAYSMIVSLNAQTAGMIQELSTIYAELSYGG